MGMATDFSQLGQGYQEFDLKRCGDCSHCEVNLHASIPNVGTCDLLDRNVDLKDIHENCPLEETP
jgi:hypothetical protein